MAEFICFIVNNELSWHITLKRIDSIFVKIDNDNNKSDTNVK
jgi:hypothetical protein